MGYRKIPTIYSLSFADPEMEGLEVRMKSIKIGRVRRLMALFNSDSDSDTVSEMLDLFTDNLISWNLEDEDGEPVPANREGVEDQETDFVLSMIGTWLDGMTGPGPELGKGSTSGANFPVALPRMEAL